MLEEATRGTERRFKASARLQSVLDPTLEKPLLRLHAASDVDWFWKAVQDVIQRLNDVQDAASHRCDSRLRWIWAT